MSKSEEFAVTRWMRELVLTMMRRDGRDFTKCELCGEPIAKGRFDLHHEKYEGATYYDLRIVCKKCNHAPANVGLY